MGIDGTAGRSGATIGRTTKMEMPVRGERETSSALSRLLAWIVLALMASATLYSAWIALVNFNRIGV